MTKKILFIFFSIFLFLLNNLSFAEDFYFEGDEIEIINNGEILKSRLKSTINYISLQNTKE